MWAIPDDALSLLVSSVGPFALSQVGHIKSISVGKHGGNANSLRVPTDSRVFSKVLRLFGGSLTEIRILEDRLPGEFLASVTKVIIEHCASLKSFSAYTRINWMDIAAKHSTSLENLVITTSFSHNRFSCPATPLLELKMLRLDLREGLMSQQDANELASFLAMSGGKLEEVDILWIEESSTKWVSVIDELRKSCLNLRRIFLRASERPDELLEKQEVKRLLMSRGKKLKVADLVLFPTSMCEEILDKCPNVLCNWIALTHHEFLDRNKLRKFVLLAPRVQEIMVENRMFPWVDSVTNREKFRDALLSMANLKTCFVRFDLDHHYGPRYSEMTIRFVFETQKSALEHIHLYVSVIDRELRIKMTPSLRQLQSLHLVIDEVRCENLKHLLDACKRIKKVHFRVKNRITHEDALHFVTDIAQVAWTKQNLVSLFIWFDAARDHWDSEMKEQFMKNVAMVVQKFRLRRCVIRINRRTFLAPEDHGPNNISEDRFNSWYDYSYDFFYGNE